MSPGSEVNLVKYFRQLSALVSCNAADSAGPNDKNGIQFDMRIIESQAVILRSWRTGFFLGDSPRE